MAQRHQRRVAATGGDEGDAKWQARRQATGVFTQAAGQRQRGLAQQVDKVGVAAQLAVAQHGLRCHRRPGRAGWRGGHHQHIDLLPQRRDLPGQRGQRIARLEGRHRIKGQRVLDHLAHGGVQRVGLLAHQGLHHGVALGHPRAVVQQLRHGVQRRHVDGLHVRAPGAALLDGLLKRGVVADGRIAAGRRWHAYPQRHAAAAQPGRLQHRGVEGRLVARALDHGIDLGRVGHRQRQHRDDVQRAAGWQHAGHRHPAGRGFEADQVVEAGRHPARPCRVGAQRKHHQPARHHRRRARAAAAADVSRVEGVGHLAVR